MTKKSTSKSKTILAPKYNPNGISFNRYSFRLGNIKFLTDYLNLKTKNIIIKYYRQKKFQTNLYQQSFYIISEKDFKHKVLSENEAIEIIKDVNLRPLRTKYQSKYKAYQEQVQKIANIHQNQQLKSSVNPREILPKDFLNKLICKSNWTKSPQKIEGIEKSQTNNKKNQLEWVQRLCKRIEKQIFVSSIIMIIQLPISQKEDSSDNFQSEERVVIIFEQSYPHQQFFKRQLIGLIGHQAYKQKIFASLKVFEYLTKQETFYNPQFLTCHDCMRVIADTNYPQNNLICKKKVPTALGSQIISQFALTPQEQKQRIIRRNYFSEPKELFSHPYIQYYFRTQDKNQQKYRCNRAWCGECKIRYKRHMDLQHCQFCDRICRCFRCKLFQRLITFMAHFIDLGGKNEDLEESFIFNRVFKFNEFNLSNSQSKWLMAGDSNAFLLKKHLQLMFLKYKNEKLLEQNEKWKKLKYSEFLAGFRLSEQKSLQNSNSLLLHTDKWKFKNKLQIATLRMNKTNYRKQVRLKEQRNVEAKILNFSQQKKQKFMKAQLQQFRLLKRKFQRAKVLMHSDPLTNPRTAYKDKDITIIEESQFKKTQRIFQQTLEIKQLNPFDRVQSEMLYLRSQQNNAMGNENPMKYNNLKGPALSNIINEEQNNYDSIW